MDGSKQIVEATKLFQYVCKQKPRMASYWLNWAAALRGLRRTVAPISRTATWPLLSPNNEDLQEALQQILAEMARPEAAERCRELWSRHDEELKASYLFSRQFLGIGTAASDSQELAIKRVVGNNEPTQISAHCGPTSSSNH